MSRAEPVRPLEQHVFLKVREAELVGLLVAHARPHDHVDGHDVTSAVILDDEAQAIGQHLVHDRIAHSSSRDRWS